MKKGSALLIVLGMLAFMVMSAVAYSMFMRQSRLPSSFLRQKIAASQLVKAGLAAAMSRIDACVGGDPYPYASFPAVDGRNVNNYWHDRVLVPGNVTIGQEGTVSTLTLEALAYLPAPLVNTTRFWSRRTPTAEWQSLGYDAGRFAFTAVNVSDYYDINRVKASVMRDSTPTNRISMAYLFEAADSSCDPEKFDDFIDSVQNDSMKTRFVSLADFNLSLYSGEGNKTGLKSPFCMFIENGASDGAFYGSLTREEVDIQKFVTDSWYPAPFTNATPSEVKALTNVDYQPLEGLEEGLDPLMKNAGQGFNIIKNGLNLAERAALVDYLDDDNVPTSLALPTAERTPMITGLQIVPMGFKPTFMKEDIEGDVIPAKNGQPADQWMYRVWTLDNLGDAEILFGGSAVFPFKRDSGLVNPICKDQTSFDVEVLAKCFFTLESEDDKFEKNRYESVSFRPASESEWTTGAHVPEGYWSVHGAGTLSVSPGSVEEDTLCTLKLDDKMILDLGDYKRQICGIKYKKSDPANTVEQLNADDKAKYLTKPLEFRTYGTTKLSKITDFDLTAGEGDTKLRLSMVFYVRIKNSNDTVDLVPATMADDATYNGFRSPAVNTDRLGEYTAKEGVLSMLGPRIVALGTDAFNYNANDVTLDSPAISGLRIYCNDPRYNWAPEDWYSPGESATISGQDWLNKVADNGYLGGSDYRPNDIFQFVANTGYLQSMGEIDLLPLVRDNYGDFDYKKNGTSSPITGSFFENSERYDDGKTLRTRTIETLANRRYMWKQRWAYGQDSYKHHNASDQDPRNWGIVDSVGGVAANPFGEVDLMKGALANTPYDWIVTSEAFHEEHPDLASGREYCYCEKSSAAKLSLETLNQIANNLGNEVRRNGLNWERDWGDMDWDSNGDPGKFFGVDTECDIHDVDRKFLCSYWRSCFANNQQLYLIFVRAEPTVMGSATAKHTPSQLGARAVALVWREPVSSISDTQPGEEVASGNGYPHRMRILFYHQFE